MRNLLLLFSLLSLALTLAVGCGKAEDALEQRLSGSGSDPGLPPIDAPSEDGLVVRSRAMMTISTGDSSGETESMAGFGALSSALSATQPISVENGESSSMSVDNSHFAIPSISNTQLSFGYLTISSLFDNNLRVCGSNHKQKCSKAYIRMYTRGTHRPGLYNEDDDYGAPITAGTTGSTPQTIGLDVDGSAKIQTVSISSDKHVLRETDFPSNTRLNIFSDFTNAGAGRYTTQLVIEYVLGS